MRLNAGNIGGIGGPLVSRRSGERSWTVQSSEPTGQRDGPSDPALHGKSRVSGAEEISSSPVLEEMVRKFLEKLNSADPSSLSIRLETHEETGRLMVVVVKRDTGEVVKVIPPVEWLETLAAIQKYIGLILDERA